MTEAEKKIQVKERRKKVSGYNLITLAEEMYFTVTPVGKYFTLKEHDSVRINPQTNTFRRYSRGIGGDPVSFLMEFGSNMSQKFKSIDYCLYWLEKKMNIDKIVDFENLQKNKKVSLILPEKDNNSRRIFAYLNKTRGIDQRIIKEFLHRKMLYQSKNQKNCVFVGYDEKGKVQFATERGTLAGIKFMHELPGCDYDYGILFENKNSDTLIVTEAVIDMMSLMCLNLKTKIHEKHSFLAMGSVTKDRCVYHYLQNHPEIKDVLIALDNDYAGKIGALRIKEKIKQEFKNVKTMTIIPTTNDWNDDLRDRRLYEEKQKYKNEMNMVD